MASAIVLAPTPNARLNTVQYFDQLRQISQRVLDRTICKDVQKTQSTDTEGWTRLTVAQQEARVRLAKIKQARNMKAVESHCINRLRAENLPYSECLGGYEKTAEPLSSSGSGL